MSAPTATKTGAWRTTSAAQAASVALALSRERDANKRARLLSHLMLSISDLDRAAATAVAFYQRTEALEEQMQPLALLAQEMGLKMADPSGVVGVDEVSAGEREVGE